MSSIRHAALFVFYTTSFLTGSAFGPVLRVFLSLAVHFARRPAFSFVVAHRFCFLAM